MGLQLRRATAERWEEVDPVLALGRPGYETDTGKLKIGDGVTPWTELGYHSIPWGQAQTYITTQVGNATTGLLSAANNLGDVGDAAEALANLDGVERSQTQAGTLLAPTPTTQWSFQPRDPDKAPFKSYFAGASFNGTWDTVWYSGYNADRADTDEPVFAWCLEQDYNDGADRIMECYWEWHNSARDKSGRPFFARVERDGTNDEAVIQASAMSTVNLLNVQGFAVAHSSRTVQVGPFSGGDAVLLIRSAATYNSRIDMQYNGSNTGQIRNDDVGIQLKFSGRIGVEVGTTGSAAKLGFFGATPAAKPTGVAVTAAGIHAALVTLGLIAA